MFRTQVYLTEEEREGLRQLAGATDRSQSELIREAVDRLLESAEKDRRKEAVEDAAGMWRNRTDLPDFEALRRSWDRS